jgi:hypothetical protein
MPPPHIPKYVSPNAAAESRARLRARLYWTALAIPIVLAFLAFGYSDQAPAFLRDAIIAFDRMLGYPLAALIGTIAGR